MNISREKQQKLAYVARRYYLEDQKQSDIARELGVSRPLISRMLSEARALGVVEITVHEPGDRSAALLDRLRLSSSIRGASWWRTAKTTTPPTSCSLRGPWSCCGRSAPAVWGWAGAT